MDSAKKAARLRPLGRENLAGGEGEVEEDGQFFITGNKNHVHSCPASLKSLLSMRLPARTLLSVAAEPPE